jgi:hypothetical protein
MKKYLILAVLLLLAAGEPVWAQGSIQNGTYLLNDGKMMMSLMVQAMPDGKYMVNGNGQTKDGKTCRIGDLGEWKSGKLILGICALDIKISGGQLDIKDSQKCIFCEPGAYVTGTYKLQ